MLESGVTTNVLPESKVVSLSIKVGFRFRVTITQFPDSKDGKIDLGGVGIVMSKSGESGLNPRIKHGFDWWYASVCAKGLDRNVTIRGNIKYLMAMITLILMFS